MEDNVEFWWFLKPGIDVAEIVVRSHLDGNGGVKFSEERVGYNYFGVLRPMAGWYCGHGEPKTLWLVNLTPDL